LGVGPDSEDPGLRGAASGATGSADSGVGPDLEGAPDSGAAASTVSEAALEAVDSRDKPVKPF
jgi:hypothetical protein